MFSKNKKNTILFASVTFDDKGKVDNYGDITVIPTPNVIEIIKDKEIAFQNFQVKKAGPEGDIAKKEYQMTNELIFKINEAVEKVAIDKGYDFIFDGSISLLYGKPTHDLTDDVLHELRKVGRNTPN